MNSHSTHAHGTVVPMVLSDRESEVKMNSHSTHAHGTVIPMALSDSNSHGTDESKDAYMRRLLESVRRLIV